MSNKNSLLTYKNIYVNFTLIITRSKKGKSDDRSSRKITPGFLKSNKVIIYPESEKDAVDIQRKLFALGFYRSYDGSQNLFTDTSEVLRYGINVKGTTLTYLDIYDDRKKLPSVSSKKFWTDITGKTPSEQKDYELLCDKFNAISQKLDSVLEMKDKIDEIHAKVFPAPIQKQKPLSSS